RRADRRTSAARRRAGSGKRRATSAFRPRPTTRSGCARRAARCSRSLFVVLLDLRLALAAFALAHFLRHGLALLRELLEALLDAIVHASAREAAARIALAGRDAGEEGDRLVDRRDRIHVEPILPHGLDDVLAQHQVLHVVLRDQHALLAGESPTLAGIEEALDLLVDASDDLHLPVLVHRAGDGERLLDREPRDRRQQRARLGDGSAVAFDAGVGLLEDEGRMDRQRRLLRVARAEIRRKDQHAFRMDRAAELDLALDVDDLAVADPHVGRDAGRLAELKAAQAEHRKAVDLTDLRARSVDQEIVALDFFLKLFAQTIH